MRDQEFTTLLEEMAQANVKRLQEHSEVVETRVLASGIPWSVVYHFAIPRDISNASTKIDHYILRCIEEYLDLPKCHCHSGSYCLHTKRTCVSCGEPCCEFCTRGSKVSRKIEICKVCWEQGK